MIKLVALDMDGTLLDSSKRAPEDFADWVKKQALHVFVNPKESVKSPKMAE